MKKYKFKIENITEKVIEIEAENNKKAVKKLAGFMAKKGANFAKVLDKDRYCFIHLQEISKDKKHILFADDDEINRDVISNLLALDEIDFDEIEEENEEENTKEHIEVICERCGNCILLDDIIHHLDS